MHALLTMLKNQDFWYKLYARRIYLLGFVGLVVAGGYVGVLLFGDHSLSVLMRNIAQRDDLIKEVNSLQDENASLQKSLFELKGLEP